MIRRGPGAQGGFTLVEVLAVIAIFGISMLALSRMFAGIQEAQRTARYSDLAVQAARNEIEFLRGTQAGTLTINQTINFTSSLPADLPPGATGIAVARQPANAPNTRQVDVTVSFSSPAGTPPRTITLTAYIDPQVSILQ